MFVSDTGQHSLTSVDVTDFEIQEHTPFLSKWWSHKFNGPGLHYKLAISIKTEWIVAYNGSFECGCWLEMKKLGLC